MPHLASFNYFSCRCDPDHHPQSRHPDHSLRWQQIGLRDLRLASPDLHCSLSFKSCSRWHSGCCGLASHELAPDARRASPYTGSCWLRMAGSCSDLLQASSVSFAGWIHCQCLWSDTCTRPFHRAQSRSVPGWQCHSCGNRAQIALRAWTCSPPCRTASFQVRLTQQVDYPWSAF